MPNLTDLMLDAHLMHLVHKYLSVKDIILFYTSSIHIIKISHLPLYIGLLLYEYPFLSYRDEWFFPKSIEYNLYNKFDYLVYYNYDPTSIDNEHSIFIYTLLKAHHFDDIIAYLGSLSNIKERSHFISYSYPIRMCFNTSWAANYIILSFYNKFTKPYFYIDSFNKLFDLENFEDEDTDESHYIVSSKKSIKIFSNKIIKFNDPDLLRFIDSNKAYLIKLFKSCKIASSNYVHKSDCKSHKICEMLNWQQNHKL